MSLRTDPHKGRGLDDWSNIGRRSGPAVSVGRALRARKAAEGSGLRWRCGGRGGRGFAGGGMGSPTKCNQGT